MIDNLFNCKLSKKKKQLYQNILTHMICKCNFEENFMIFFFIKMGDFKAVLFLVNCSGEHLIKKEVCIKLKWLNANFNPIFYVIET